MSAKESGIKNQKGHTESVVGRTEQSPRKKNRVLMDKKKSFRKKFQLFFLFCFCQNSATFLCGNAHKLSQTNQIEKKTYSNRRPRELTETKRILVQTEQK